MDRSCCSRKLVLGFRVCRPHSSDLQEDRASLDWETCVSCSLSPPYARTNTHDHLGRPLAVEGSKETRHSSSVTHTRLCQAKHRPNTALYTLGYKYQNHSSVSLIVQIRQARAACNIAIASHRTFLISREPAGASFDIFRGVHDSAAPTCAAILHDATLDYACSPDSPTLSNWL
jgi:hypothetical protein